MQANGICILCKAWSGANTLLATRNSILGDKSSRSSLRIGTLRWPKVYMWLRLPRT
jgi:hypothetical protein